MDTEALRGMQDQQNLTNTWTDIEVLVNSLSALMLQLQNAPEESATAAAVASDLEKRLEAIRKLCGKACDLSNVIQQRRKGQQAQQQQQQHNAAAAAAAATQQQQQQQQGF